ncbi:hypothetical protein [Leucobacter denitrificans]|uniref:DoxX family membrane protein n=1 Tax=Leucobacter denitrificans TaxID=683042 RepID=A0A7G9S2Z8_9MICO|nr:hypothetical protein [Leucobacter denitrificans]QNN62223.1 hypothetical protein H9L06_07990 [Leucobacter denitrificans]
MSTSTSARVSTQPTSFWSDGNRVAFVLLRTVFTVAPILFGLDKFVRVLTDDWERYLAPWMDGMIPGDAYTAMMIVGVVEIVAGLVVAIMPRFGGLLVAVWLAGIIVSLVSVGGYLDVALRDFGLLVGALALSALAFGRHAHSR